MKRRNFIKLSLATGTALLAPSFSSAADVDISGVRFNANTYNTNNAQTIMIFLYGGPSELSANISNMPEIKEASQSNYDAYFRGITPTANNFWQEAGGTFMEELVFSGDLNVFRTCYSATMKRQTTNHMESVSHKTKEGLLEKKALVFSPPSHRYLKKMASLMKIPFYHLSQWKESLHSMPREINPSQAI